MAVGNLGDFLRRLTRQMGAESLTNQTDGQLVERALVSQDAAAFEAIISRHGTMVYRVCWRVLQHPQDSEDAFQATFLVLAQRLRTVRTHASLAGWLHSVAHRIAVKAKTQSAARRRRETRTSVPESVPPEDVTWKDLRSALDVELAGMPENWRQPLILCYLEGRTQDEAAAHLGWSKSTLRRHLEKGRDALGRRLAGRGITAPAALTAILLSDCIASAAPASELVASTVEAAAGALTGKLAAKIVTAKVAALTEGMVKAMFIAKLKTVVSVVMLLGFVATGGGLLTQHTAEGQSGDPSKAAAKEYPVPHGTEKAADPPKSRSDMQKLQGTWVVTETRADGETRPVPEAIDGRLVIAGDDFRLVFWLRSTPTSNEGGGTGLFATFKLNTKTSPRNIDLTTSKNPESHELCLGIYQFDGDDRLTICLSRERPGNTRPAKFEAEKGANQKIYRLRRAKQEKSDKKNLPSKDDSVEKLWELRNLGVGNRAGHEKERNPPPLAEPFYIVQIHEKGKGDNVWRFPVGGYGPATVVDAIAATKYPAAKVGQMEIWIARLGGQGESQVLPIDWLAITKAGATSTNYQLQAGDRLILQDKKEKANADASAARNANSESGEVLKVQLAELSVSILVETDKQILYLTSGQEKKGDVTYRITDKTVVLRGNSTARMKFAEIRPGERVTIELDKDKTNVKQLRVLLDAPLSNVDLLTTSHREFRIPVTLNPSQSSDEIKRLHLYESTDKGKSWAQIVTIRAEDAASGFSLKVAKDGIYWYCLALEDKKGRFNPDREHLRPQMKVRVDTSKREKSSIDWRTDYAQARKEAAEKKKLLLLWFHQSTPNMDIAADKETRALINEKYIPVMLDRESLVGKLMQVRQTPTVILADSDGKILVTIDDGAGKGYLEPAGLTRIIREVLDHDPAKVALLQDVGLVLAPVTAAEAAGIKKEFKNLKGGMRVLEVRPASPADHAKLREGDILVGLQEWEIVDHESASSAVDHLKKRAFQSVRFVMIRGNQLLTSHFTPPPPVLPPPALPRDGGKDAKK